MQLPWVSSLRVSGLGKPEAAQRDTQRRLKSLQAHHPEYTSTHSRGPRAWGLKTSFQGLEASESSGLELKGLRLGFRFFHSAGSGVLNSTKAP